ncbi:uncharacterized protein DFL_005829 [Arthrobotrys flagrans]|uniref:Uncharacterized protein n=1 Tax=Arthrobotrys flagrans TaxID=97331 RepID=A0A436ZYM9_ARTFL|nr:hypothetical protein DFL_005829 [Arthrobotrys flagrans]
MESESEETVEEEDEGGSEEVEYRPVLTARAAAAASRKGRRVSAPARQVPVHSKTATLTPEPTRRSSRRKTVHGAFDVVAAEGSAKRELRRGKK